MTPALLMIAPNGARLGKADHPAVPLTIAETVATARDCFRAGADALHLHVRDEAGAHTLDAGRYREALAELARQVPGMQVQITTEAAGRFAVADQHRCLTDVAPDWASISIREIARAPERAPRLYAQCAAQGTRVQHILYDRSDIALLTDWRERRIVRPDQTDTLLVLGRYGAGHGSDPADIAGLVADLPEGLAWMLCAFGDREHACLQEAARLGGALRVGFENSRCGADGGIWPDNAASVAALRHAMQKAAA